MYHIFFLDSCVDKRLGSLHILIIEINAAMNTGVYVSFRIVVFSGYMPSSAIAGSYGRFIPIF